MHSPRLSVPVQLLSVALAAIPALGMSHAVGYGHQHPGDASAASAYVAGVLHPMTGLDHLLAIVALALWASSAGWWHRLALLGTFSWLMVIGAMIATVRPGLPALETMIAASVVVGGSLLVFGRKFSLTQGLTLGAIFALIHGYAHGQEIGTALTIPYFAGFVTGFLLLASSAMAVGHLAGRRRLSQWMRPAGVGFVCMGGLFLSGVL